MNVDEHEVPIYAGWADSIISIADVIGLPIVSLYGLSSLDPLTTFQHVRLIRHFSHRHLFAFTLLSSGTLAAITGFCTAAWQLVALRGLIGLVHFAGFISVIALGGLVDQESRNEGKGCGSVQSAIWPDSTAFSWRAAGSAIGSMSGSVLGGFLSEPYGRVPLLSGLHLFRVKPYAAPGVVLLILSMVASAAVMLLVNEVSGSTREVTDTRPIHVIVTEMRLGTT